MQVPTARRFAIGLLAGAFFLMPSMASAQHAEVSGAVGYTFSDGVSGNSVTIPTVGTFDRIDPKDSFSWGARIGIFATKHAEIGFLFNEQQSKLQIGGSSTFEVGNLDVRNYHGYFAYNFGPSHAPVRPYLLAGVGATQDGSVNASVGGTQHNTQSASRFSSTWAGGVKVGGGNAALLLEGRWTPAYIKSDTVGWWCDPFWGCYPVGNHQYANQFELAGGITLRF